MPNRNRPITPIIRRRRGRDGWYMRWLEGDDLDSEISLHGRLGGAAPGQRDFGLKSPKQQLFQSHPPHLPKVALFPAGGQLALALLVKGQGHLKHLSSSLILY